MKRLLQFLGIDKQAPEDLKTTENHSPSNKPQYKRVDEEEFFLPIKGLDIEPYLAIEDLQGIHHISRYHWAKKVLQSMEPRSIIDIACGAGYGSYILAKEFSDSQVKGVDYDSRAINHAVNTYRSNNLRYRHGDMVLWEVLNGNGQTLGKHDVIISFDTIEHINHPEIALLRIAQNLEDNGVLILSTPISFPKTDLSPAWTAHKIEYGAADLTNLLKRYFHEVLLPEEGNLPNQDFWTEYINKDKQRYLTISNPIVCKNPIRV
ncbi:MAG: class I SAM-dependent methyltransferase [Bacteroidetes bacterium]|nr:class I SAM-dependent methyltransferase [Bacteroidota bacterium]